MTEFNPDSKIDEALARDPRVVEAFKKLGLKCNGCAASEVETLRHAALYHEKELATILADLNALKLQPKQEPAGPANG